jgi:ornithine decarboxylase
LESARIFGRTCDSADVLADRVFLPRLSVGDRLHVDDMGAYTFVSSSEFNGFPKPDVVILE